MPSTSSSSSQPLLPSLASQHPPPTYKTLYKTCHLKTQTFLSSRYQHYLVLGLVSFDLLGIFADILIELYQCDFPDASLQWNTVKQGLGIAGLVFSCLFMVELVLSVWGFGWRLFWISLWNWSRKEQVPPQVPPKSNTFLPFHRYFINSPISYNPPSQKPPRLTPPSPSYFHTPFHTFDALIILLSFTLDVLLHGILEEVASLVVILRLWRFFKIIEEFGVGAQEQMDGLELRIRQLEGENKLLRVKLGGKGRGGEEGDVDMEAGESEVLI
ncbi:hypothetical protein IFR05_001020 [Cadophora sp. M221]|nr:hypothetical protein IFR05_001020 [Cadophora sp. M221]